MPIYVRKCLTFTICIIISEKRFLLKKKSFKKITPQQKTKTHPTTIQNALTRTSKPAKVKKKMKRRKRKSSTPLQIQILVQLKGTSKQKSQKVAPEKKL